MDFGPVNRKPRNRTAFTLLELMVVILIVSILAVVGLSLMQGRVDSAKWSEANTTAGTIRRSVSAVVARQGVETARAELVGRSLDDTAVQEALGFIGSDLTGTYFTAGDYMITAVDAFGHATVEVTGSRDNAPAGTKTLSADGSWQ